MEEDMKYLPLMHTWGTVAENTAVVGIAGKICLKVQHAIADIKLVKNVW